MIWFWLIEQDTGIFWMPVFFESEIPLGSCAINGWMCTGAERNKQKRGWIWKTE